jgi:hypothetical protein
MALADDLYDIGVKLDELKALKPDKEFSVQNKESNVGVYFVLRLDGNVLSKESVTEIVDILEALRLQYVAEG